MLRPLLASLVAFGAPTCPRGSTESPELSKEDLEFTMLEHFDRVSAIRDAVVYGELETVVERADALVSETRPQKYPAQWRPHVEAIVAQSKTVAHSATIASAASGVARLSAACGSCHVATEAKLNFGTGPEPSEDDTVAAAMDRHRWAVDRLWEGIVGPSDYAWEQGAMVFGGMSGCEALTPSTGQDPRRKQLCETVERLGRRAKGVSDGEARVRVYGDFLATCSGCHSAAN